MADEPPRVDMFGRPILGQEFDIPEEPSTTGKELVPYEDPTSLNIDLSETGPMGEHRRQESRRWGGRHRGI